MEKPNYCLPHFAKMVEKIRQKGWTTVRMNFLHPVGKVYDVFIDMFGTKPDGSSVTIIFSKKNPYIRKPFMNVEVSLSGQIIRIEERIRINHSFLPNKQLLDFLQKYDAKTENVTFSEEDRTLIVE